MGAQWVLNGSFFRDSPNPSPRTSQGFLFNLVPYLYPTCTFLHYIRQIVKYICSHSILCFYVFLFGILARMREKCTVFILVFLICLVYLVLFGIFGFSSSLFLVPRFRRRKAYRIHRLAFLGSQRIHLHCQFHQRLVDGLHLCTH